MTDPFHGTWSIALEDSFVWDEDKKDYVEDKVGAGVISLSVEDGVQDYEILYGDVPKFRLGYKTKYDNPDWADYICREVISDSGNISEETEAFKSRINATGEANRQFELGKPYGQIKLLYIDRMNHYRIMKNPLGSGPTMILRTMAVDEKHFMVHTMDAAGVKYRTRKFVRIA